MFPMQSTCLASFVVIANKIG